MQKTYIAYLHITTVSLFLHPGEVMDIPGAQRKVSDTLHDYKSIM